MKISTTGKTMKRSVELPVWSLAFAILLALVSAQAAGVQPVMAAPGMA